MATRKRLKQLRSLDEIMQSDELLNILETLGAKVLAKASTDPNAEYVASLEMHPFYSHDRVSVQIGASPVLGPVIEAKRGTLARALGGKGQPELFDYVTKSGKTRKATQAQIDAWTRSKK